MTTQAGKVQLRDIKAGKTFYLIHADFPLVGPGMVGTGEVQTIKVIRAIGRPFFRRLSACMAFKYVDKAGKEGWLNLDAMAKNHAAREITDETPYFVLLATRRATRRFWIEFERRSPTPSEELRVKMKEATLNANQRGMAYTPQFNPSR
jgi:hypothetical protein